MAVAFRSKSWGQSAGTTEPAGAANNDILFMLAVSAGGTPAPPAGWNTLATWTGTNSRTALWWQRRSGTPNLTWTGGTGYLEWSTTCWSGCETNGNPWNVYATNAATQRNPDAPDCPSVTTTVANTIVVAFGLGWKGSSGAVWAAPSGYTIREDGGGVAGNDLCVASKALASPATENPGAFTTGVALLDDVAEATVALMEPQVIQDQIPAYFADEIEPFETVEVSGDASPYDWYMNSMLLVDDMIPQFFEDGSGDYETAETAGEMAPYDWYADAPLPIDNDAAVAGSYFPDDVDEPELTDAALYPDYWAQAPPLDEVQNQLNFIPLAYDYDADDQPKDFDFADQPLPADVAEQFSVESETADEQLEEPEEPFGFEHAPLPDNNEVALPVSELAQPLDEDEDQADFIVTPTPDDVVNQLFYIDGGYDYSDPDPPDGFFDQPLASSFVIQSDQIFVADSYEQLEDEDVAISFDSSSAPLPPNIVVSTVTPERTKMGVGT